MGMTTSTETAVRQLKGVKRKESSFGKVDFVIYPNVMLVNNCLLYTSWLLQEQVC